LKPGLEAGAGNYNSEIAGSELGVGVCDFTNAGSVLGARLYRINITGLFIPSPKATKNQLNSNHFVKFTS
jgi:hypothetical protein